MNELLQMGAELAGRIFLAAAIGVLISYRRDTDRHQMSIVHAHTYLAMAGAFFIMIIGDQMERAVGLIGVATIIRYRYAIRNPKDAGTLIIALGLGMACGASLEALALAGTVIVMIIVRLLDWLPAILPGQLFVPHHDTRLRVITTAPVTTLGQVETVLKDVGVGYTLTALERKDREGRMVTVIEVEVRFTGDLDIARLTQQMDNDNIVTISWRDIDPAERWK